jgi:hypothetical protein
MENPDPGSGLEKDLGSRIRDKHRGFATLENTQALEIYDTEFKMHFKKFAVQRYPHPLL